MLELWARTTSCDSNSTELHYDESNPMFKMSKRGNSMKWEDFKKLTKKEMIEWLSCHEYTMACFEGDEE